MWKRFSGNGGTRAARHGLSISDDLRANTLATLSDQVAILDRDGNVIATNEAWKNFDCQCGDRGLQRVGIGANYLDVCRAAEDAGVGGVEGAILGLRAVLDGSRPYFSLTYVCHSSSGPQWFQMTATSVGSPGDGVLISHTNVGEPPSAGEASTALIAEQKTGEPILRALTENLAKTIGARFAFLSELVEQADGKVRLLALWNGERFEESFEYEVAGTPCQYVLRGELCAYPENVQESFPHDAWLTEIAAECYLAVPLFDSAGEVIGHLGVIHDESLDDILLAEYVLGVIAAPASAELERLRLLRSLQESDATARALLNAPIDTAALMDTDGTIIDLNEVAALRLGLAVEEAVGKNVFDLFPPDVAATRRAALEKVLTTRKPLKFTDERAGKYFESSIYPVLDSDGNVVKVAVFATDVTARVLAGDQLRRSEEQYRTLVETITHGIEEIDLSGVITFANKAYHQIYGYEDGELIGKSVLDLSPSNHDRTALQDYLALVAKEEPAPSPMTAKKKTKSGRIIDVELAWDYKRDDDGQVTGLIAVVTDITARKQAEAALAQSERRIRQVTEHISEIVWLSDPGEPKLLYVSPAYEEIWGRSRQSLYDDPLSWVKAIHPDDVERITATFGTPEEGFDQEYRIIRPDGSVRWIWDRGYPIRDESASGLRTAGITVDITERKLAEETLTLSESRIRLMTEHISEMVWLSDPENHKLLYVSQAYERIWGRSCQSLYDDPKSWLEAVHPDDLDRVRVASGKAERVFDEEYRVIHTDGSVRWVWDRGFPVHETPGGQTRKAGITVDITERKLAEEKLTMQARVLEKMAEGVVVCNDDAKIVISNPAFDTMFGYERGELTDQHASVLNAGSPEENGQALGDIWTEVQKTGFWSGEISNVRKDGTLFTTAAHISSLEVSGKTAMIAVQEDITERKLAEETVRQSAERNASLIDAIPDMMFSVDRQGVYLDFVPADGQEPLFPPSEFLGKTVFEVLPVSLAQDLMRAIELVLDTGRPRQVEYDLEMDDSKHEYEARIVKSKDNEALSIVRDVTALKRMEREEELRRVRDELEGKVEKEMLGKNPYGLTFREFTVLHMAANGEADKEIAERLGISTFTVSKHVANILGKMAASSRTEACVRALREGLLT